MIQKLMKYTFDPDKRVFNILVPLNNPITILLNILIN